jgi:hypothetical protein
VDQGQFNDPDFISSTYQRKNVKITDNFSSIMVSSMKLTTSLCDIKGKMSGLQFRKIFYIFKQILSSFSLVRITFYLSQASGKLG